MAEWRRVAALEEVPPGALKGVEADGERVVLANVDGDVYALEDQCSHQDYPLSEGELEGAKLECVFHGAKFDVCNGRALQLPAVRPVKTYPVEIRDEEIYIEV